MTSLKSLILFALLTATLAHGADLSTPAASTQPATRATRAPTDRRVLIISIDGCRPDLLLRADTPVLHGLLKVAAYTMWAQTTAVSVTIPSHVSMLTGAKPGTHEMEWNHDLPLSKPVYPKVPTLFELARKAGYTTGVVAGKSKFELLNVPDSLDAIWIPEGEVIPDLRVLGHVLQIIHDDAPQVLFVHLPENDRIGHTVGWGSAAQIDHLHAVDASIGAMLDALRDRGDLDHTLVLITADHGGAGISHGPDDPRSRSIPWIAVGPGVRRGVDLTTVAADRTIRIEDTFATAAAFLELHADYTKLDGRPVTDILDRGGEELMESETTQPLWSDITGLSPLARPAATTLFTPGIFRK